MSPEEHVSRAEAYVARAENVTPGSPYGIGFAGLAQAHALLAIAKREPAPTTVVQNVQAPRPARKGSAKEADQ